MGNFALQAAVESWFSYGKSAAMLFDEVFLAAADERFDSFTLPMAARLSRLADLTPRISIYYSVRDIASLSQFCRQPGTSAGTRGPDTHDYDLLDPPDASHQYYRRSPKVRADIAATMRNDPNLPGGLIRL
jgi:esterase/lipase superfamily enzyme